MEDLVNSLCRYVGQTVTICTNSGGASGCGFTGVLAAVNNDTVKLITNIGAAPSCPFGSNCTGCDRTNCGNWNNFGSDNWLGSVTEIPICQIASFTHNAL